LFVDLCADRVHVAATGRATSRRTAASWGSAAGVQAAVNGDFFRTDTSTPIVYGQAVGSGAAWPIAQTGEASAYSDDWYYRDYGWIAFGPSWVDFSHTGLVKRRGGVTEGFQPGTVSGARPAGTIALVSGFPELVTEGRRVTCSSPTASSCFSDRSDMRARHPRTAMGLTEDRRTLILLVVDGRSTVSVGMYGTELASLLDQLGAWQAFNLDGGGSSQMWLAGRGTINAPSDGSPRSVANHWGVFAGTAGGRPVAPGSCIPREVDDCFRSSQDGSACGELEAVLAPGAIDLGRTSDVDGDGRADVCARSAAGWMCHPSAGDGFAASSFAIAALSDAAGFDDPSRFSTVRTGDLDGDGRADVCARSSAGMRCWISDGAGYGDAIEGPALDDAGDWDQAMYFSTIRLADVDGDGRDDLCARGYSGMRCWRSTGDGFEAEPTVGPAWGNAAGWSEPSRYGTIRVGDVDGDGRDDLCGRAESGVECFASDGAAHTRRIAGPAWSDASGWDATKHWSTIRLADVDGDGRDDLCGRSATDLRCHLSTGDAFAASPRIVAELSDASGWGDHDNYATLRVGDVSGDGADDLCARANGDYRCYALEGEVFRRIAGPALSDASGWSDPRYYATIRLGDVSGDGLADVCARGATGYTCWPSTGDGFGAAIELAAFRDAQGWGDARFYSTMRVAGPACVAREETCDGTDEDCDGAIDEG
ncbi:MAG: phosphodiester glycosidase family protein, partial [Myxococcota bacterium]|nr:phosphodiester glycosidase family protein [Myxococcota bacterium]